MARKSPRLAVMLDEAKHIERGAFHQIFDVEFHEIDVHEDVSELEFNGCVFKKVNFNQNNLDHCTMIDCVFEHCDLSNVDASSSCFRRVEFIRCNLVGTDCSRSVMEDVLINKTNVRFGNFSASQLRNCEWKDSKFDEASINDCRIKDLVLADCSFVGAEFLHTPLKHVDFSSCMIDGIMLSGSELKGVIVSEIQAVSLARLLGIVIKE